MRVLLLHPDRDFDPKQKPPRHAPALTEDLALDTLVRAMAGDDAFLLSVAWAALFSGFQNDAATILYRQEILQDFLNHPAVARELYGLAVEAADQARHHYFIGVVHSSPSGILLRVVTLLQGLIDILEKLRHVADVHAGTFQSRGFAALLAMLQHEFEDAYVASVRHHLATLTFKKGVLVSAGLSPGNAPADLRLYEARGARPSWIARLLGDTPPAYTIHVHERDIAGAQALSALRNRSVNLAANAVGQAAEHILSFFQLLRTELAFYICCLNLRDGLAALGAPIALPRPAPVGARRLRVRGLYDVCLALSMGRGVTGNSVDADQKSLVLVTGANQGGKSTFLRSVGVAQLMMQCGMFVGADSFAAELCRGLFTHYRREEDTTMRHGKLAEELSRMSDIVDALTPDALLLLNESFAATNEIEGSEIATQLTRALLEKHVKVVFVTHLYQFARRLFDTQTGDALFLRAERRTDGTRTFRVVEGEPLETSYGADLYREVFEGNAASSTSTN